MSRHAETVITEGGWKGLHQKLNSIWHRVGLIVFVAVVLGHWAEHLVQAFQIYALGWPRHEALGLLGLAYPWLVHSEWLHYIYAILMLVGLWLFQPGFTGRSLTWWQIALWIQAWHHVEHLLLLGQAMTGVYLFGASAPTSILQYFIPRVELHLFYNGIVTLPMLVSMWLHRYPSPAEARGMKCSCARHAHALPQH